MKSGTTNYSTQLPHRPENRREWESGREIVIPNNCRAVSTGGGGCCCFCDTLPDIHKRWENTLYSNIWMYRVNESWNYIISFGMLWLWPWCRCLCVDSSCRSSTQFFPLASISCRQYSIIFHEIYYSVRKIISKPYRIFALKYDTAPEIEMRTVKLLWKFYRK